MSDDLFGSNSNFFMPESRSISFAVEEEDPWSAAGFDPVEEIRKPLTQSQTFDEEMVTEGITAANVLGKVFFFFLFNPFFHFWYLC